MPSHELADRLSVDRTTIYRWETGTIGIPDFRKAELAGIFGVSVAWLMRWEQPNGDNGNPVCEICGDRKSA